MKKIVKLFVIYFPVILVISQVLVNVMSFLWPAAYYAAGFYLNTFFGTNVLFALFLLVFCFMFRMCAVSRWAAGAELLFAVNYMVVQQDNLYNIMFQVIVGALAIIATFWHYVKKFPLCRLSHWMWFHWLAVKHGSCKKGFEAWERHTENLILKEKVRKWTTH